MAEAQTYLSKCISQKRSIYSNRTVSYMIVLLELLTVLLEYIDIFVIAVLISKNSYYYTNILPIMLALCSMLSGTYYAHNYASIIGGSLSKGQMGENYRSVIKTVISVSIKFKNTFCKMRMEKVFLIMLMKL